jgi:AraC-like DNA-binding protein
MEPFPKKLDFLTKHWAPFQRGFPAAHRLVSSDFLGEKGDWIRTTFYTCNFSLILRGRGEFRRLGRVWPVEAPCVITQWPGEALEYGPAAGESWCEHYLVYSMKAFAALKRGGLIDPERPTWPIRNPVAVGALVREFGALARHPEPEAVADRVDRVAERLVLETWLEPTGVQPAVDAVRTVAARLRAEPGAAVDFNALAREQGLSPTSFRRRWAEAFGSPPARTLQELRMREACRLLVETTLPVHEVAGAVGFQDEFYFTRRFGIELGMPPRDYRRTYRLRR